jgi:hypothetical protein
MKGQHSGRCNSGFSRCDCGPCLRMRQDDVRYGDDVEEQQLTRRSEP